MREIFEILVHRKLRSRFAGVAVCVYGERVKKCPGVAVTQSYSYMLEGKERWSLTHIKSGKGILRDGRFKSVRGAKIVAGKGLTGVDWERRGEELKKDRKALKAVLDTSRKML